VVQAGLDHSLDATCRVRTADGSTGSGCVFAIAEGRVWIITASHVVGKARQAACEFWREGHQSRPLAAAVAGYNASYDVATLVVPVESFGGVLPKVVPLAPPDYVVRPGETITSAGCARGAWATGVKGHALGYWGSELRFTPPPADGRSGSAIFDCDGKYVIGVVTARRTAGEIYGIATSIQAVYAAFGRADQQSSAMAALAAATVQSPGRLTPVAGPILAQCPGGVCPGSGDQPRWYLLPYRYREQFRNQPAPSPSPDGGGAWPTLPPETTPAPSPPSAVSPPEVRVQPQVTIDVAPLAEPLQGLADAQKGLSDAVAAYLEAEARRKAAAEAEQKLGAVAPQIGNAASAALSGDFEAAADTVGESGAIWAMLADILWTVLAPLLGIGAVGFGFGKVIVRALARALGPSAYDAAKSAVVDWWKDDNDTPEEAKAKQRMAEATADATIKKLNGGAAQLANGK